MRAATKKTTFTIVALIMHLGVFHQVRAQEYTGKCKHPYQIKCCSVPEGGNTCGETCLNALTIPVFKVLEPTLKCSLFNQHPCQSLGYPIYNRTELEGGIFVDIYGKFKRGILPTSVQRQLDEIRFRNELNRIDDFPVNV